ncbi:MULTISPECIES: hypothetical protein, partial [unclassified Bradyrhizobium]
VPAFAGTTTVFQVSTAPTISDQIHISNNGGHDIAFPRRITPEFCERHALSKIERARGMPGEGLTHGPPAEKSRRQSPQVQPINRHSPRGGFNAYIAISSVCRAC